MSIQGIYTVATMNPKCDADDKDLIAYQLRITLFLVMCPELDVSSVKNRDQIVRDVRSALEEIAAERKCKAL